MNLRIAEQPSEYLEAPGDKYFSLDGLLKADCPECQTTASDRPDWGDHISYPNLGPNSQETHTFICDNETCNHEWEERYRIRLRATLEIPA